MAKNKFENMNIVIVGHVDHGKSTIIGRLLADTNSLPEGKLAQVKETCRRNSKPFEFAFLLDALKDEQAQGITIDAARVFFKTPKRKYIIIDAPGHIEFLKNMVTGAARAEAALLVIDAQEGVRENSKRHGYLLAMLGIKQVVVLMNKMDLINYDQVRYEKIAGEYKEFLAKIGVTADSFIPVSGFQGDNIAAASPKMPWYQGISLLEKLDLLENKQNVKNQAFRMPVQGVYKFTADGDDRRIIAGTIETGKVRVGDNVVFYPSGKKSMVKSIERFNASVTYEDTAGSATGFTLDEQVYITRGELACLNGEPAPVITTKIKGKLFWLGKSDLNTLKKYYIKIGTQKVAAKIEKIITVLDASTLAATNTRKHVQRNEVAEVIFALDNSVAVDTAANLTETSRFVIVDNYEISGGGVVMNTLDDGQYSVSGASVSQTEITWSEHAVKREERAVRFGNKPALIIISGEMGFAKEGLAGYLERGLFLEGRIAYNLEINPAAGKSEPGADREAFLKKLAEQSNILLNAGILVITTIDHCQEQDLKIIKALTGRTVKLVWAGELRDCDGPVDLHLGGDESKEEMYFEIRKMLINSGTVLGPGYN